MRILIAAPWHYKDRPGGASKVAFDEAEELVRRGEEVWVLAPGDPTLSEHELKDGIHHLRYFPEKVADWNPGRAVAHQRAASAVLARHVQHVDAIHGHVPLPYLAAIDCYGDSVRSCYTIHSPVRMEMAIEWRNSSFLRRITAPVGLLMINQLEAKCLRRSHVITALSQYTIDCIGKIHGQKLAQTVRLIPGWVDTSRFIPVEDRACAKAQLGWPGDVPILFTLRRLVLRMGLDRLLTACYRLLGEGLKFHLVIGGVGPLRGKLEEQARMLGMSNSVVFLGRVEDRVLPLAYAACDAFVLPTAELECFGLIAIEALSAGRPVLATPVGAIPEIIRKIEGAWLARSAEVEDIADLLRQYLTGELPEHAPWELHDLVHRDYCSERVLEDFIEAAVGSNMRYNPDRAFQGEYGAL
jgi:glycosyltransferase involved in cell wall biosynthesis